MIGSTLLFLSLFLSQAFGIAGQNSTTHRCEAACKLLLQSELSVYSTNTTAYNLSQVEYWSSFQSDVSPACFVEPASAEDVAEILSIVRKTQCPFAVKSGGHAAFTGASNIPGGITILLHKLNQLSLSDDQTTTQVGTGNLWIDVYNYLTPQNLSVVGGRVAAIGTGGLTLGGGISFFSGRYGWACDGVKNYELVTANSLILQVNQTSHPDLYFALRGGGNNFGIVTRLDLTTFPQGPIWGGNFLSPWNTTTQTALLDALYWYGHRAPEDIDAALYVAFGYVSLQSAFFANTELVQTRNIPNPPIFANFTALPSLTSTLRSDSNMSDLALELNASNPNGLRETYQTHNFLLTPTIMSDIIDIFKDEIEPIKDSVKGLLPTLLFQIITTNTISHFSGNALGINGTQGPLLLMSLTWWWTDTSADAQVLQTARRIVEKSVQRSKETGAFHPSIYQNYAGAWQDVFEGYGEENLERLRRVSREWDPEGVFQRLQPGYFKLWK